MNNLLFAVDDANGFGYQGDLPWGRTIKPDLRRFKTLTWRRIVFAGSVTMLTLPRLKERLVGRITNNPTHHMDFSLDEALAYETIPSVDKFFIGGAKLLTTLNGRQEVKRAYITVIKGVHPADVHLDLPVFLTEGGWQFVARVDTDVCNFFEYRR